MSIVELTPANYASVTAQDGIVLVDCWAGWCGPCRSFAPVFEEACTAHGQHQFAKLDTVAYEELTKKIGIEQIPTLQVYRDGILLLQRPGTMSAGGLADVIRQAESLDMSVVRADIAAAAHSQDDATVTG